MSPKLIRCFWRRNSKSLWLKGLRVVLRRTFVVGDRNGCWMLDGFWAFWGGVRRANMGGWRPKSPFLAALVVGGQGVRRRGFWGGWLRATGHAARGCWLNSWRALALGIHLCGTAFLGRWGHKGPFLPTSFLLRHGRGKQSRMLIARAPRECVELSKNWCECTLIRRENQEKFLGHSLVEGTKKANDMSLPNTRRRFRRPISSVTHNALTFVRCCSIMWQLAIGLTGGGSLSGG